MEYRYFRPKENSPENNRGYRFVLVIIDNFSKIGWTFPLQNKNAKTLKDSFENILKSSKRKSNLIETDRGNEFYNNFFQNFSNNNNKKFYFRNTCLGAVFAERFVRSTRDLFKRPAFEKGDGESFDILPKITKQCNIRIHSSPKLTPIQASLKKNEGYV